MSSRSLVIALLVAALGLSLLAGTYERLPGDLWLARQAQDIGGWFEPVAKAARAVTATQTVIVLGVAIAGAAFWRGERQLAAVAAMEIVGLPFLQSSLKNVVGRPRPDGGLVERRDIFTSESFPSGHTMSGTVLFILVVATAVALMPEGRARVGTISLAALVLAVSMAGDLHLGMHWPSDVAGGVLWACVLAGGACWLTARGWPRIPSPEA